MPEVGVFPGRLGLVGVALLERREILRAERDRNAEGARLRRGDGKALDDVVAVLVAEDVVGDLRIRRPAFDDLAPEPLKWRVQQ